MGAFAEGLSLVAWFLSLPTPSAFERAAVHRLAYGCAAIRVRRESGRLHFDAIDPEPVDFAFRAEEPN